MKINKLSIIFFTLLITLLTSCSYVQPNYEGVFMENNGKAGKPDFSIQSGKVWTYAWGTELYQVPMFQHKGDCPKLAIFAKGGGEYTIDPSYTYYVIRGRGVDVLFDYKQFYVGEGKDESESFFKNIEENTLNTKVLNAYREEARNFTSDSLMYHTDLFENQVQERLRKEFNLKGFYLEDLTSSLIPPESMRKAIEARNNQIQEANKIENAKQTRINQIEIDVLNAETKVKIAKLETEANQEHSKGLTPEILKEKWIEKWDGTLPNTVAGSNTDLIIQTK